MTFDATRGGFGFEQAHDGESVDWWTPPEIVQALGHFDLDPCGGVGQKDLADKVIRLPENGLTADWQGRVFCNPPYGPRVGQWVSKMNMHGNGIMLIFARVETKAWRDIWFTADAILFPFRRIKFLKAGQQSSTGTAPSAFVAWGAENAAALGLCGIEGALIENVCITSPEKMSFAFNGEINEYAE